MKQPLGDRFTIMPLGNVDADRSSFSCGNEALDQYLRTQAGQDARRHYATVLTAYDRHLGMIAGFYTLCMSGVDLNFVPPEIQRKLPKYDQVPAVRLGRLAVALTYQGMDLGSSLLIDAMRRSIGNEIAWAFFAVDAKDERARSFYKQYAFHSFLDDPYHLFLTRKTIETMIARLSSTQ